MPLLLMSWLLESSGHQRQWWLRRINGSLFMSNNFNYSCNLSVKICFVIPDVNSTWQGLITQDQSLSTIEVLTSDSNYGVFCTDGWTQHYHDDVIKWKHFPRHWPFVRGIHRSPVNSPHKGQWHGALMFFFHLCLNKRLSKHSWFATPSPSLWRHCNNHKGGYLLNLVFA